MSRGHNNKNFRANPTGTSSTIWADKLILPKPDETFRYIFQNIQGLPVKSRAYKHQQIGSAFATTEADTFGLAELNLNLRVLSTTAQFDDRFQFLRRNHSTHAVNQHDTSTATILYGGMAQITMGPSSHRVLASGSDESGLGRWVWTLLQGRNQTKLRVISGYRPNPDPSDRTGSVYSQHERYLTSIKDDRNPR